MKVGLFIPCYIDQFYPNVGIAALALLEKLGVKAECPPGQTCCGQPLANGGYENGGKDIYRHFVHTFQSYDYIVSPSGSCTYHVCKHYDVIPQDQHVVSVREKTYELTHFITHVLGIQSIAVDFPYTVGLHVGCHGLRGLHLGQASESSPEQDSDALRLLRNVRNIRMAELSRPDECCGFGGLFAIGEDAVSGRMGLDKAQDHLRHGVEVITGTDVSCLMHIEGIIRRQQYNIKTMHIAEILNGNRP